MLSRCAVEHRHTTKMNFSGALKIFFCLLGQTCAWFRQLVFRSGHPRRQTLVPQQRYNSKHKHTACRIVSVSLSVAVQLNSWVAPPPVQAWTASTCPPCCYRRQDYYTAAASLLQHFWRSTPAAAAVAARLRDLCSEAVLLLQLKQHKLYVHIRKLALYSKACLCASACVLASSLLGLCACASLCAAHWSFSKKDGFSYLMMLASVTNKQTIWRCCSC